jgi:hypothetical protein
MPYSLPSVITFPLHLLFPSSLTTQHSYIYTVKMGRSALLIGSITHARKEWDELSSLLGLKVSKRGVTSYVTKIADNDTGVQDWLKR